MKMNYIVLDTETTNGFDDPFCYDVGYAVLNEDFEVIETRSFVVADVFLDKEMMANAYFADKVPQYWEDIKNGTRELKTFRNIRKQLHDDCKNFGVTAIIAHNARFDYRSCQRTQRWLTKSKYRYFFPYGCEIWDSLKMARQTFAKDEDYKNFYRELYPMQFEEPLFNIHLNVDYPFNLTGILYFPKIEKSF